MRSRRLRHARCCDCASAEREACLGQRGGLGECQRSHDKLGCLAWSYRLCRWLGSKEYDPPYPRCFCHRRSAHPLRAARSCRGCKNCWRYGQRQLQGASLCGLGCCAKPNPNEVAKAGATTRVFFVDAQSQNAAQEFQQALEAIRGKARAWEYWVPKPSDDQRIDHSQVTVPHMPAGQSSQMRCAMWEATRRAVAGGWSGDVDPAQGTPTVIRICPASGTKLPMDVSVKIRVGCETVVPRFAEPVVLARGGRS